MVEIFHSAVDYLLHLVDLLGYIGIFLLMALESSFIPFPSEVVLIPAGVLVKQGKMNFVLALAAGTLGSLAGAYINYFLSLRFGRAFILKYGSKFGFSETKFSKVESAFLRHGNYATFVGRLIFGIRQWVSIPAGLSRMNLFSFTILTSLGAGIWSAILITLGLVLGGGEGTEHLAKQIGYWMFGVIIIMSLAYYFWWTPKKLEKN